MNNGVGSFNGDFITFGCFSAVCIFTRQLSNIIQGDFLPIFYFYLFIFVIKYFLNILPIYSQCFISHFAFKVNFISFEFYHFDPNLKLFQLFFLYSRFIHAFFVAIVYRVRLKRRSCSKCLWSWLIPQISLLINKYRQQLIFIDHRYGFRIT